MKLTIRMQLLENDTIKADQIEREFDDEDELAKQVWEKMHDVIVGIWEDSK